MANSPVGQGSERLMPLDRRGLRFDARMRFEDDVMRRSVHAQRRHRGLPRPFRAVVKPKAGSDC